MSDPLSPRQPVSPAHNPVEQALNAASGIRPRSEYLRLTKTLTYSYIFVLPLLVIYEVGIWLINKGEVNQIRIGADLLLKTILGYAGIHGTIWVSVVIAAIGAVIMWYERRLRLPFRPGFFGLMFLESALYGVVIGLMVASVVTQLFSGMWLPMLQVAGQLGTTHELILSLGAGVYEELLFRLILVSTLVWILKFMISRPRTRYIIAAVIGALIFSAVHYIGALGDQFTLQSFTFRFLMGLALNAIYLWRGFGIAAMTHALFDVFVTLAR
ncbi:MAG: CPBP family intramembrane glutamic endopeptidase [Bacteroidota bacterium]